MNQLQAPALKSRRKSKKAESVAESVYDDGYLRVEHQNYYAAIGGERLKLARADFRLISVLTQNTDGYVSAETIWRHLWTEPKPLNTKSLRVIVCGIRRRLAPYGINVESMMNVGYRLLAAETSN